MQSIQRALMLLKSDTHPSFKATLKLQTQINGLDVSLSAQGLPEGIYSLYLFDKNKKDFCAGQVDGALFHAVLDLSLSDIAGAAVVCQDTGGFILISSGLDWRDIRTRFRLSRIQPQPKSPHEQTVQTPPEAQAQTMQQTQILPPKAVDDVSETPSQKVDTIAIPPQQAAKKPQDDFAPRSNAQDDACSTCPHVIRQDKINPFPSEFPQSEWVKISYPGPAGWWHYISGIIYRDKIIVAKVLGVPGEYGMAPPIWLEGFGTYMRCTTPDAHGYWLMFQDAQTGEVLDMALSPHDG